MGHEAAGEDVDFDTYAVDASMLHNPQAEAASDRVEEYAERVCGIESGDRNEGTLVNDTSDETEDEDEHTFHDPAVHDQMVAQFVAIWG